MRGGGYADVLPVLQVPDNKADAVPCKRLPLNDPIPPQPKAAPFPYMHIFSQPDIRPERLKIALIGNLSHKPAHLHAGFLAIGVAFPVMPVESTFYGFDFSCSFNKVFEFPVIEPVAALVSIGDLKIIEQHEERAGPAEIAGKWPTFDELAEALGCVTRSVREHRNVSHFLWKAVS